MLKRCEFSFSVWPQNAVHNLDGFCGEHLVVSVLSTITLIYSSVNHKIFVSKISLFLH